MKRKQWAIGVLDREERHGKYWRMLIGPAIKDADGGVIISGGRVMYVAEHDVQARDMHETEQGFSQSDVHMVMDPQVGNAIDVWVRDGRAGHDPKKRKRVEPARHFILRLRRAAPHTRFIHKTRHGRKVRVNGAITAAEIPRHRPIRPTDSRGKFAALSKMA